MKALRALSFIALAATLGAGPPPTVKETTDSLDALVKSFWERAARMDAILAELGDVNSAFPSSRDPEGLILRRGKLHEEAMGLLGQQKAARATHREYLRGVFITQSARLVLGFGEETGPAPALGGSILVSKRNTTELKASVVRFEEKLRSEDARFKELGDRYSAKQEAKRWGIIAGSFSTGLAVLVGYGLLARRRKIALPVQTRAALPQPPADGFQRRALIGRGTWGEVYEAYDAAKDRRVALKVLPAGLLGDTWTSERLRAINSLVHPNIAALLSMDPAGGHLSLAYEFVEGKTLLRLLQERRRLSRSDALAVLRGVGAALHYSHVQGVIHWDVKPANIMLTEPGEVKVLDFALVHQEHGTPPYEAPEQQQAKASGSVDLYALSVTFYEMLTGELPFKGPNFPAQKREALYTPASLLVKELPTGIDAFFKLALAPEPSRRFATAEALVAAAVAAG